MFAVPGWKSVSATSLRTQTDALAPRDGSGASGGRKRKRNAKGTGPSTERRPAKVKKSKGSGANGIPVGRSQRSKGGASTTKEDGSPAATTEVEAESVEVTDDAPSGKRARKRAKPNAEDTRTDGLTSSTSGKTSTSDDASAVVVEVASVPPKSTTPAKETRLTPLQQKMRDKLTSARFRHLNETLYTTASSASRALFDANPGMFTDYHAGFRQQVVTWPENPVDTFISLVGERAKVRPGYGKHKQAGEGEGLPRARDGWCTIVDLGCGEAALAQAVSRTGLGGRRKVRVQSYDLAAPNEHVTKADIRDLPLGAGSVDVAVFCLALMGTTWVEFVEEAYRVLRWKGELWVAEIKSRFARRGEKKQTVVEHSVGKRRRVTGGKQQRGKEEDDGEEQEELRTEVDGGDRREETDVAGFVEVLRRRGFVLKDGQRSVDLDNKMFVRMEFVKGAPAVTGKNVREEHQDKVVVGKRFVDGDGVTEEDEARTLKPCLYKVR